MPLRHERKWKYDGHTESHGHHETLNKGQTVLHCAMYDDYFRVLSYSSIYIMSLTPVTQL
jgi:hypothetical protein